MTTYYKDMVIAQSESWRVVEQHDLVHNDKEYILQKKVFILGWIQEHSGTKKDMVAAFQRVTDSQLK